jgi:DNA-binding NtrC family response regulator
MLTRRLLFLTPAQAVTTVFPPLRDAGYELGIAENLKGASVFIRKSGPGIIFARPSLPGFRVEDLLAVGAEDPNFPPVIVITDKGTAEEAERLMSLGARDYWLEPLDVERIVAVARTVGNGAARKAAPPSSTLGGRKPHYVTGGPRIVGRHPAMTRVLQLARQVAGSRATVLITGESGTGKEMFARYLHAMSKRADKAFVAVNCAALPEHLLESELFGHEKGAFTGAIARKPGKFELADGGTLLLDEISEMDMALQAKLLRVLQEGEIDRVGGTETLKVDVRVLATTNRDLEDWVKQGKFRQDLYFRLNVIPLRLPSLRERSDDVLELAHFFMNMYVREYALPQTVLSQSATDWLRDYDFPGNVRELQNLMERAVLLANGRPVEPRHFLLENDDWPLFEEDEPQYAPDENGSEHSSDAAWAGQDSAHEADGQAAPFEASSGSQDALRSLNQGSGDSALASGGAVIPLHEMERIMILKGLEATSGNRTQAADLLGISVRTLRNKLNEYRAAGHPID